MKFEIRKIENCFADSRSYEYTLPLSGNEMLDKLSDWEIRINNKLRRPVAIAERQQIIIKFVIADRRFRVSFPENKWQEEKEKFEKYLENLICKE